MGVFSGRASARLALASGSPAIGRHGLRLHAGSRLETGGKSGHRKSR